MGIPEPQEGDTLLGEAPPQMDLPDPITPAPVDPAEEPETTKAAFDESKHKRDFDGKFTDVYTQAAEEGDEQTALDELENTLKEKGYVFHRGKDPESSKNIVQFVDDPSTNKSYGENQWVIHKDDLSEIPDYVYNYSEEYFGDRESVNPKDILESADAWDDPQFVSDLWQKFGDQFESEGIVGFKTDDGAVMFPGYGKEYGVIPANAIEKDANGNVKSIEERFARNASKVKAAYVYLHKSKKENQLIPTPEMAQAAQAALEARRIAPIGQRGMTAAGLQRARDIAAGVELTQAARNKMKSFFSTAESGEVGSKQWQTYQGWGGDAGKEWSNKS
jgi:hypothetical protein